MASDFENINTTHSANDAPDVFDLRNALMGIVDSCLAYWWTIPSTIFLCCLGVLVYIMSFPPIFKAEVTLLGEADNDASRQNFYAYWNTFRKNDIVTEAEMLVSSATVRKVVEELDLTYDQVYHPPMSHLVHLWGESLVGKSYRKVKRVFFPVPPLPPGVTEEDVERAKTVRDMRAGISLNAVKDSVLGQLQVLGPTPMVSDVANALAVAYLELRKERLVSEARNSYNSLYPEVEETRRMLEAAEREQQEFFDKSEMFLRFEKDKVEIAQWIELKSNLVEMQSNLEGLVERRRAIKEMMAREDPDIIASKVNQISPVYSELESQVTNLETQLAQTELRFKADSPEVQDIQTMIGSLSERMGNLDEFRTVSQSISRNAAYEQLKLSLQSVETEIEGLRKVLEVRNREYSALEAQIKQIPTEMIALNRLTRESNSLEKRYSLLKERLDLAEISMATAMTAPAAFSIVDTARSPTKPVWPKKKILFAAAILLGGFVGLTLSVLLNFFVGKVTESRLKLMHGYPLFAQLQHVGGRIRIRLDKSQLAREV